VSKHFDKLTSDGISGQRTIFVRPEMFPAFQPFEKEVGRA
jgi:hypothetical protein